MNHTPIPNSGAPILTGWAFAEVSLQRLHDAKRYSPVHSQNGFRPQITRSSTRRSTKSSHSASFHSLRPPQAWHSKPIGPQISRRFSSIGF